MPPAQDSLTQRRPQRILSLTRQQAAGGHAAEARHPGQGARFVRQQHAPRNIIPTPAPTPHSQAAAPRRPSCPSALSEGDGGEGGRDADHDARHVHAGVGPADADARVQRVTLR